MRKSELPVGSVVTINRRLAIKVSDDSDEGYAWRYVTLVEGAPVDYDDVYKATWDLVREGFDGTRG